MNVIQFVESVQLLYVIVKGRNWVCHYLFLLEKRTSVSLIGCSNVFAKVKHWVFVLEMTVK